MNDLLDVEPILDDWLTEGVDMWPDRSIDAVLATVQRTSQRRAWRSPWRFLAMSTIPRLAVAAMAVVAIAVGGWYVLRPAPSGVGTTPTSSPSLAPTASPTAAPTSSAFSSSGFEVPIALTLVDGWSVENTQFGDVDFSGPDKAASIFSVASMTVRGATSTDPWVPWPADIHAWLAKRAEFRPGAARSTTIGGRPATVIDVDVVTPVADTGDWVKGCGPKDVSCGINLRGVNDSGGWRIHLVVVPTGPGTGIVGYVDGPVVAPAGDFQTVAASFDRLLASLSFS